MIHRRTLLRAGVGGIGAALLSPLWPGDAAAERGVRDANLPAYATEPVKQPGRILGVVRYAGEAGAPARAKLSGDCAYCRTFDLRQEQLLVARGGGLRNVVVMLQTIARGKPPEQPPTLAEYHCTFVPHVLSLTAGNKVLLHNRDPVLNTFHALALPSGRTLFNVGTPRQDQKLYRRIARPGVVQVRCDVHPWEEAYVVAMGHPYHTVTDPRGAFVLDQVPPGRHTLLLWHERLGTLKQTVQLAPGGSARVELSYPAPRQR